MFFYHVTIQLMMKMIAVFGGLIAMPSVYYRHINPIIHQLIIYKGSIILWMKLFGFLLNNFVNKHQILTIYFQLNVIYLNTLVY